jgi:hypothetical protein
MTHKRLLDSARESMCRHRLPTGMVWRTRGLNYITLVALVMFATQTLGEDDFSIVGTYTENTPCTGGGSNVSRVTITAHAIDSAFGLCTILSRKREGATFAVHLECKGPNGNQMLGDVNFTPRDDQTVDFSDLHQTYKATLYKCPD